MKLPILTMLKTPSNAIIAGAVALLMFDLNYYAMANLPGVAHQQCLVGASLTPGNIAFSAGLSVFAGLMVAGFLEARRRRTGKLVGSSVSGAAVLVGSFTVFCTLCTLPAISIFGLAVGLGFFTEYNAVFKVISLILMLWGLYIVNKQLADDCQICKT